MHPLCAAAMLWCIGSRVLRGCPQLSDGADLQGVCRLFSSIDAYMALRPRTEQPALRPFFAAKQVWVPRHLCREAAVDLRCMYRHT